MLTDEYRKKVSDIKKGIWTGSKNPRWNGHNEKLLVRQTLERDNYTCQGCGLTDKEITQVDHVIPARVDPNKYLKLSNLQCLCPNCHARKNIQDIKLYGAKGKSGFKRRSKITK